MLKIKPWIYAVSGEAGTPGTGGTSGNGPRTFTQEEVNDIAAREKAQGRRAAGNEFAAKWAEAFGETDMATVAARFQELKDAEEAKKSEAQKAIDEANRVKAEAEAIVAAAQVEKHGAQVQAAILAANGSPERAAQIARLVDAEVGADSGAITEAVGKVKTEFPELFGVKRADTDPGPSGGGHSGKTDPWEAGRERAKARFGG